jgi:formylglycine-generating enzyme required for sulfatase activity
VSRGGSWYDYAFYGRAAFRLSLTPVNRNFNGGFRPARSSVP